MRISYEKLENHIDMGYLFRRVETNIRKRVPPGQVLGWVESVAEEHIPAWVLSTLEDGTTATGSALQESVVEHCSRWIAYLQRYPQTPEPGERMLSVQKVEQLRMKI